MSYRGLRRQRTALWLVAVVLGLLAAGTAHAARTINSVLLSYSTQSNVTSVTVPPGAAISATVNVTHTGSTTGRRWRSTSWSIGGGAFTCADHANFDTTATNDVSFGITAPAAFGTYNAQFIAYEADACITNPSPTFTLANGVTVAATVDNSTVTSNPDSVPADGLTPSTITVTLKDDAGNPVSGKVVTLAALSGSSTISSASGPSDMNGVVTFTVRDTVVESVSYRATNVTDGITLGQTATVSFVKADVVGFNVVEPGADAISGKIYTKIAGNAFALDIVALRSGAVNTTFMGTVAVEVVDSTSGGACDSLPLIAVFSDQTFTKDDQGRHRLSANTVPNVYRNARVRIKYPTTKPVFIRCSGDNFAIRPDRFANLSVTDGDAQSPGTARSLDSPIFGTVFHKAGRNFTVSASAVNGAPGTPVVTTNYAGSPTPIQTTCAGPACTASFGTLSLGASFSVGQLNSNSATYNQVGSFALQLVDSTFSGVDAADGLTAADRDIVSTVINVGRFVPDHFAVVLNSPQFGTACTAGGFTYVGQPFLYATGPIITVTARDFNNNITTLYTDAWWRISSGGPSGSLTPTTQPARYSAATGSLDVSRLPAVTADPAIADTGSGTGTLTFNSGAGLAYMRTTPSLPYDADVSLAINVIDADGVAYAGNPARFGAATVGNGIAFTSGKGMRFGRLRLQNAHGSELISLPMPVQVQYWNGAAFVVNTADNCTSVAAAHVALGNYQKNLGAGETVLTVSAPIVNGTGTLRLSAPGAGNNGSVDVSVNLATIPAGAACPPALAPSTPAALVYLQGAWCGAAYDDDPKARATFGLYRKSNQVIYQRENF